MVGVSTGTRHRYTRRREGEGGGRIAVRRRYVANARVAALEIGERKIKARYPGDRRLVWYFHHEWRQEFVELPHAAGGGAEGTGQGGAVCMNESEEEGGEEGCFCGDHCGG